MRYTYHETHPHKWDNMVKHIIIIRYTDYGAAFIVR